MAIWTVLLLSGFGLGPSARATSADVNDAAAILAPLVKTVDRPLAIFHYETLDVAKPFDPQNLAQAIERAKSGIALARKTDEMPNQYFGPGFYAAFDSTTSRRYGRTRPQLYVLTLKPSARILDLAGGSDGDAVGRLMSNPLSRECYLQGVGSASEWFMQLRAGSSENCRRSGIELLDRLGVDGILGTYGSGSPLANLRTTVDFQLVLVTERAVDWTRFAFRADDHAYGLDSLGALAAELYRRTSPDAHRETSEFPAMARSMVNEHLDARVVDHAIDRVILGAGVPRAIETPYLMQSRWYTLLRQTMRDDESYALALRWERVKNDKFEQLAPGQVKYMMTTLHDLRALVDLTYAAVATPDFTPDRWQALLLKISGGDIRDAGAMSALTGEPGGAVGSFDRRPISAAALTVPTASIDDFGALYRKLGVGRRLGLLVLNAFLTSDGEVPLLFRADARTSGAEAISRSTVAYRQILRKCVALYEDPRSTLAQIQGGSCGLLVAP